jgi:NAD(P)H-hydrate epimerase
MLDRLDGLPVKVLDYGKNTMECLEAISLSEIIIDAVFGTGFKGSVIDNIAGLFKAVNDNSHAAKKPAAIFALDMPSGADADTGSVEGACIKANFTVTFASPKTGQFTFPAAEYCGVIKTVNIGIPDEAFRKLREPVDLLEPEMIKAVLPPRSKNSNKGDFGRVFCLCGSMGMTGAAYLSAAAATRCGAGLITLGVPKAVYGVLASKLNEVMVYSFDDTTEGTLSPSGLDSILTFAEKSDSLLIGCGLSQNGETRSLIRAIISNLPKSYKGTVILDADGINAFEGHIDLLRTSYANIILTPHPGEMSRLNGKSIADIQASRLSNALNFAVENGVTLVLKGAYTVIATKDGRAWINPTGNPGMAKGGSGDLLAGMIASFAAQGMTPAHAACCGTFIHGRAGDRAAEKFSQYGMIPTDMLMEVPQIFRELSR